MSLTEYRRKRNFSKTKAPRGKTRKSTTGRQFVIQKHAASHLHFDFRLELDGTLKSWAVPRGPSLDPKVRALAIQVEDHPLEYGSFEGLIPEGEYGGGTVMVWDQGTWEPHGDAADEYARGHLRFQLHGNKLRGGWTLTRMKVEGGRAQWLLIKHNDDTAVAGDAYGIVRRENHSARSDRTMEEIAEDADRVWTRNGEVKGKRRKTVSHSVRRTPTRKTKNRINAARLRQLAGARSATMPSALAPELATLSDRVPEGDAWVHEVKFDGYRLLAHQSKDGVHLLTRNGNDWTTKFRGVTEAISTLPFTGILDGELVAIDENGVSDFQKLQNAIRLSRQNELVYFVFDLPFVNGYDLRQVPLLKRKETLSELILSQWPKNNGPIRYSEHIAGNGEDMLSGACKSALEGVVSKRVDSTYESRRTGAWLKTKCHGRQEFVIGGFTRPTGSRTGFGSLLLGYYDRTGALQYVGNVGTGFSTALLRDLKRRLDELTCESSPFSAPLPSGIRRKGVTWVKPLLVGEVEFTEWTADGALRHPSFQGLREDKKAKEVTRETTTRENLQRSTERSASRAPQPSRNGRVHSAKDGKRQICRN